MTRWQLIVKILKALFSIFVAKDYVAAFKVVFPDTPATPAQQNQPPFIYNPQLRKMVRR